MRPPTDTELAYIAGIIDADGCIGGTRLKNIRDRKGAGIDFTVHVTMADRQPLELLHELYGGHIRQRKAVKLHWRPYFVWQAYGERGAILIRAILPFLRVKRVQGEVYLLARSTFTGGPHKGYKGSVKPNQGDIALRIDCLTKIQALNQRQLTH